MALTLRYFLKTLAALLGAGPWTQGAGAHESHHVSVIRGTSSAMTVEKNRVNNSAPLKNSSPAEECEKLIENSPKKDAPAPEKQKIQEKCVAELTVQRKSKQNLSF